MGPIAQASNDGSYAPVHNAAAQESPHTSTQSSALQQRPPAAPSEQDAPWSVSPNVSTSAPSTATNDRVIAAVIAYANDVFGIDVAGEPELFAVAAEAHSAPVDLPWLEYTDGQGYIYYYNSRSKATSWDHPATAVFRERLRLKQLELRSNVTSDRVLNAALSHRSIGDGADARVPAADAARHQHYLNIGPALRIVTRDRKHETEALGRPRTAGKSTEDMHVIASTAQYASLSQLLYVPTPASPTASSSITSSAPAPAAKILAINADSLDVSINHLDSLKGLEAFSGLVQLHVHMNQLTSLEHLSAAPFLLTVLASKNLISSLSVDDFARMQLRHLDLSNNRIAHASAVATLPSLTFLNLSANTITAVTGFLALTNLVSVKLANNCLRRLGPSAFAPSLQTLDAHGNGLTDAHDLVACLRSLTNLHALTITQNPVEKVANFQVDVVAAAPSLKELNYLVIKQGFREELQLAAVTGIVEDVSQRLKFGYMRAVEREQQRLQQCINSAKLKETFYEKAFEGYKKKLESEFGAAIYRVQNLSSDAVASGNYDTGRVTQEAAAVMHSFAQASSATGDFGRAVAADVFAQASYASVDALPNAPAPLMLRSFDAGKEAAVFELSDVLEDDGADDFPEVDVSIPSSSVAPLSDSLISSAAKAASTPSASNLPLTPAISFAAAAPTQLSSAAVVSSSSSSVAASSTPSASAVLRPAQRPRPLSPKPSSVKALRSQDASAVARNPPALAASSVAVVTSSAPLPSPRGADDGLADHQQSAVRASSSCAVM